MERKQIGDESICHQWDLRACILYIMNSCMPKWQMDMEINQISKSEFLKKENCVGVWYLVDTKQHENRCIIHTPTKQTSQLTPKHLQHLCLSSSHACWYWTRHKKRIRKSLTAWVLLTCPAFLTHANSVTTGHTHTPCCDRVRQGVLSWLYPSEQQPGPSPALQIESVWASTLLANANTAHLLILIHPPFNDVKGQTCICVHAA